MILSIEKNELGRLFDSLNEKLRYIEKDSYMEYVIKKAKHFVGLAVAEMQMYENQLNVVERTKK
jgi:hypothetical protein